MVIWQMFAEQENTAMQCAWAYNNFLLGRSAVLAQSEKFQANTATQTLHLELTFVHLNL